MNNPRWVHGFNTMQRFIICTSRSFSFYFSSILLLTLGSGCAGTEENLPETDSKNAEDNPTMQTDNGATAPLDNDNIAIAPAQGEDIIGGDRDGIQYFGRWDFSDPENPSASWGAVYLTTQFTGTSFILNMTDSNNDFQYTIDGGEMKYLSPGVETEHQLAMGLEDKTHTLEFYRRSGGSFGRTTIKGVTLDSGATLIPTTRPQRKIEVMGDSISVGYGNEGMSSTSRATENGYEAYGPQLARQLNAQWSVIAHSGQGMVRNLGEEKSSIADGIHMPDEFKMSHFPGSGMNPEWDFSSWQPDVLIVTLGTNDFSWPQWDQDPGPDYELSEAEYITGYQEFLMFAREVYPNAHIFAVGTFLSNSTNQFGRANDYICEAVAQLADLQAHCIDPGFTGETWLKGGDDYIGDWTHPTVAGHTIIANQLALKIKPVLNW